VAALGAQAPSVGLILEAFVPFERELSVVAVRGRDGEFRTWPLTENWHEQGVLARAWRPARASEGARGGRGLVCAPRRPRRWSTSACSRSSCSCAMAR
jgi:formate-dependent phosphoribosylglycinamide formyltransferase (GAR transformylase)